MNNEKKENRSIGWKEFVIIGVLIFIIWFFSYYLIKVKVPLNLRGQFGDTFGAINSLFSALAFAGVLITIIIQRIELKLQREELGMQREEMKNSRVELKRSASAQQLQSELQALNTLIEYQIHLNEIHMKYQGSIDNRAVTQMKEFEKRISHILTSNEYKNLRE